jgi:chromosome segregation ATPase
MNDTIRAIDGLKDHIKDLIQAQNEKARLRVQYFEAERDRLDSKDNDLKEIITDNHSEINTKLDNLIDQAKITNSRINKLEIWRETVKAKIGVYGAIVGAIIGFFAWLIPMLTTK